MAQSNEQGGDELRDKLALLFYNEQYEYMLTQPDMFDVGAIDEAVKFVALDRKQHELDARIDEWKAMGDFLTEADKQVLSRNFLKLYKLHGERLEALRKLREK